MPWSCQQWADNIFSGGLYEANGFTPASPQIIDDGNNPEKVIWNWFEYDLSAQYPKNIFIDHEMKIYDIIETDMTSESINEIINQMLSEFQEPNPSPVFSLENFDESSNVLELHINAAELEQSLYGLEFQIDGISVENVDLADQLENYQSLFYSSEDTFHMILYSSTDPVWSYDGLLAELNFNSINSEVCFEEAIINDIDYSDGLDCFSSQNISGDINEDGILNILDVLLLVNLVIDYEYNEIGDVNEDGVLNILDILVVVNWILSPINAVSSIQAWAQDPTVSVTTIDSVYCDSLYAIALDQNGQALPEISLNFQLDTSIYDGVIYPINPQTGNNSEPGTALYCPEQGFVGNVEINVNHSTTSAIVEDTIEIEYIDNTPECEECVAELTLVADEYILPYGINLDQTSTGITATMTDSSGYDPPENTLCSWQAIQQNEDGDWIDVGSIDEFSYFGPTADPDDEPIEMEATTTFQMYDAAGLVTIVGTASEYGLTDTIYINTITTQPSYIEIIPPFPNEIVVQGGGGIESTDIDVAIIGGNGNYISIPYWVRFTLIGAPLGCNMDGDDDGDGVVDVLSQNGISTVSVISGTRPGAVQLRVELYPDVDGVIDDSDEPIAVAEGSPVAIATGPPYEGVINYSYVDIQSIGGGLYQIPIFVNIWDVHSNPVADSTNVYFSVRGLATPYSEDQIYLAGDQVYWKSEDDIDSLVYECKAPLDVPADLPPPFNNNFEAFTCQNPGELLPYTIDTDVNSLGGVLWEAKDIPANIEPVAKTGNENPDGDSYPGMAWTYLYYSSSTIFDETVLFAQTYGADGTELVIDSRENHDGAGLVLPFTPEGTIGLSVNTGSGQLTADAPELFVTVTGSIIDYYQYPIDNGILVLNAPGATIVNVCDGIDQNNDGTGICFGDDDGDGLFNNPQEELPYNECTVCGENGGTWIHNDNDFTPQTSEAFCGFQTGTWYGDATGGMCGDGIPDDDPIYGITNSSGQVTWTIRYDLGINICGNCGDNNAQCNDFESNITVNLLNPQGGASDPQTVTVIQPFPEDMCP